MERIHLMGLIAFARAFDYTGLSVLELLSLVEAKAKLYAFKDIKGYLRYMGILNYPNMTRELASRPSKSYM